MQSDFSIGKETVQASGGLSVYHAAVAELDADEGALDAGAFAARLRAIALDRRVDPNVRASAIHRLHERRDPELVALATELVGRDPPPPPRVIGNALWALVENDARDAAERGARDLAARLDWIEENRLALGNVMGVLVRTTLAPGDEALRDTFARRVDDPALDRRARGNGLKVLARWRDPDLVDRCIRAIEGGALESEAKTALGAHLMGIPADELPAVLERLRRSPSRTCRKIALQVASERGAGLGFDGLLEMFRTDDEEPGEALAQLVELDPERARDVAPSAHAFRTFFEPGEAAIAGCLAYDYLVRTRPDGIDSLECVPIHFLLEDGQEGVAARAREMGLTVERVGDEDVIVLFEPGRVRALALEPRMEPGGLFVSLEGCPAFDLERLTAIVPDADWRTLMGEIGTFETPIRIAAPTGEADVILRWALGGESRLWGMRELWLEPLAVLVPRAAAPEMAAWLLENGVADESETRDGADHLLARTGEALFVVTDAWERMRVEPTGLHGIVPTTGRFVVPDED